MSRLNLKDFMEAEAVGKMKAIEGRIYMCGYCKYYFDLKKVGCFREGQCTRFPPSAHPKTKYKPGKSFSYYPLVENNKEACGEFIRK